MEWRTSRPGAVAWPGGTVTTDLHLSAHRSRAVNLDVNAMISNRWLGRVLCPAWDNLCYCGSLNMPDVIELLRL